MMKPPRRRASRGRSVRRPAPPLSPDMDELLSLLIEVRGTPEALGVWREIREPMEHGMSWRDVEPVMRMIQALSDAGLFSGDERFFLLASVGESVLPTRAREDPRFEEVERAMDAVRAAHGLTDEEEWFLDESPAEYQALAGEWDRIADTQMAAWFASLGEREMAWLVLHNTLEFEARYEEGRVELRGEDLE